MRVLYFGTYERDYPRNAQVISCLRGAGVEVIERNAAVWDRSRTNWTARWSTGLRLTLAEAKLWWPRRGSFDAVLVGYPGHFDVPRARRVAGKRPLIFNPLVSLHDTLVADRGRFRRGSLAAKTLEVIDRRSLRLPDLVVADTDANADFLAELGEIPRSRVRVCLVGAEERLFRSGWRPDDPFRFVFVGKLIPLHGLQTILEAARLAPELPIRVIGSGQLDAVMEQKPESVEWVEWVKYEQLPMEYWGAGCALGIFGTSEKAARVIPNKAYQALACGTPLITADTRAARELLVDGKSALLVPPGDKEALAAAMRRLAGDPALNRQIAAGGRAVYEEKASEEVLGARWRSLIEEVL